MNQKTISPMCRVEAIINDLNAVYKDFAECCNDCERGNDASDKETLKGYVKQLEALAAELTASTKVIETIYN